MMGFLKETETQLTGRETAGFPSAGHAITRVQKEGDNWTNLKESSNQES